MYDISIYPPIFTQNYAPAFIYTGVCRIYFELSEFNSLDSLYHTTSAGEVIYNGVQVIVRKQANNANALKTSLYPSEIKITQLKINTTDINKPKYYIQISSNDILGGFVLNEYYKVQIRLADSTTTAPPESGKIDSWISNNLQHFSQWSSVVLIRGISTPNFVFNTPNSTNVSTYTISMQGTLTFSQVSDTEKLKSYKVLFYKQYDRNNILEQSDVLYATDNIVKYDIETELQYYQYYTIEVQITTNNLYTATYTKTIRRTSSIPVNVINNMLVDSEVHNNKGYIKVILKRNPSYNTSSTTDYKYFDFNPTTQTLTIHQDVIAENVVTNTGSTLTFINDSATFDATHGTLTLLNNYSQSFLSINNRIVIKRASNQTDFTKWKIVADFIINQDNIMNLYWYDHTIEPGLWYQYEILRYANDNLITADLKTSKAVMVDSEDIFLNAGGKQLTIRFDPQISNLNTKVAESVTDVIGSKYPFIRQNGAIGYKTFNLSGTISCFMDIDENLLKASKKNVYGNSFNKYAQYNQDHHINLYNDAIYERFFREEVIKFLQSKNIKLFRSLTEGNILVKLTNITLTPNQSLGRQIYSFNCTAYEIGECNVENYKKYNILVDNIKYDIKT